MAAAVVPDCLPAVVAAAAVALAALGAAVEVSRELARLTSWAGFFDLSFSMATKKTGRFDY